MFLFNMITTVVQVREIQQALDKKFWLPQALDFCEAVRFEVWLI